MIQHLERGEPHLPVGMLQEGCDRLRLRRQPCGALPAERIGGSAADGAVAVLECSKQQRAVALTVLCVSAGVLGTLAYQASKDERSAPAAAQMDAELGVGAMGSVKKHGETTQSDRYTVSGKSQLDTSDQTTLTPVDSKATDETVALMTALSALR